MKYYVYILVSLKSGIRYVGMTEDVDKRLVQHNKGKSKFTKGHIPWELKHFEEFETRLKAREREKYLKSGVGREYLNKILAS